MCSLRLSYDYFINTLLYGRDSLSSEDVKTSLSSRELKRQKSETYNVNHTKGLIMRGRTNNKGFR
jgi:hypothetical protein